MCSLNKDTLNLFPKWVWRVGIILIVSLIIFGLSYGLFNFVFGNTVYEFDFFGIGMKKELNSYDENCYIILDSS